MKLARKIILSLAIMVIMCLASVIVVVGGYNQASAVQVSEKPTADIVRTEKKKPTTYHFEPGEVVFQRGGNTLNYSYTPSVNVKEEGAKPVAYEYVFGNSMDEPIAVNLKSIDTTAVRVSYAYSHEGKIDDKSSLVGSSEFELQEVENTGDKVWIYIIVHPNETDVPVQFTASIVWWYGIPQDLPIIDNVTGEVIETQTIVTGQEIEPTTLKEPETKPASVGCLVYNEETYEYEEGTTEIPYYFDGWYLDKNFGTRVTGAVSSSTKMYARYANLPADWIRGNTIIKGTSPLPKTLVLPAVYNNTTITTVDWPYAGMYQIVDFVIPNTIHTFTTHGCFDSSLNLKTVKFDDNSQMTYLGDYFFGATTLESIDFGKNSSITTITSNALIGTNLTSIVLPERLEVLGYGALAATNITSIKLPDTLTTIEDGALGCGLESITIPASVTSISAGAFTSYAGGSGNIKSITVNPNNKVYDSRNNCNAIIETATNTLIAGCSYTKIPEGVESIGALAFNSCQNLTSITIPSTVTSIESAWDGDAFTNCTNLKVVYNLSKLDIVKGSGTHGNVAYYAKVVINNENSNNYVTIGGVVYYKNTATNYTALALADVTKTNINLDSRTTAIDSKAFAYNRNLTSIIIPKNVTSIGEDAFLGCGSLKTVYNLSSLNIVKGATTFGWVAYHADNVYTTLP